MADAGFPRACLELLNYLADISGEIALSYFRTGIGVDTKDDASPVTCADREAEEAMRAAIAKTFPGHGIIGEEHGSERADAEWLWILDPIDGTASFINGVPLFGTLIGLWRRTGDGARGHLGCINHPALDERWIGGVDVPATFNNRPIRVRPCPRLAEATVFSTSPDQFSGSGRNAFTRLEKATHRRRYGTDCFHYGLVAAGWTDLACESGLKLHDYAAVVPVVEAAGGVITDWNGAALTLKSEKAGGEVLACGDKGVHAEAVRLLSERD